MFAGCRGRIRLVDNVHPTDAQPDISIDGGAVLDLDTQRCPKVASSSHRLFDQDEGDGVVDVVHHIEVGESQ